MEQTRSLRMPPIEEKTSELETNLFDIRDPKVKEVILEMKDLLSRHCGPFSKYALIDDPFQMMNEPVFTKDGINILRKLHIPDPTKKFIHKLIIYIGDKIASYVGDGTTTGMLVTLNMLEFFIQSPDLQVLLNGITFNRLQQMSTDFFNRYKEGVETFKITMDKIRQIEGMENTSPADIAYKIAYYQALTSSHGDKEVAKAVGQMFKDLPLETLESVIFMRAGFETSEKIKVVFEDNQYNCTSDVLDSFMLDKEQATKFDSICSRVDLLNVAISMDTVSWFDMVKAINEAYENNTSYAILTTGADGYARGELLNLISDNKKKFTEKHGVDTPYPSVGVFFVPISEPIFNDINAIALLAGKKYLVQDRINTINDVRIEFERGSLKLDNLYTGVSEVHHNLKPMYLDPEYGAYNAMVKDLEKRIDKCKKANTENSMSTQLRTYTRLKNLLLLNKRTTIMIGGNTYDNSAMFDVIEDCVNAARKSIGQGFLPGGLLGSLAIAQIIRDTDDIDVKTRVFASWYVESIRNTISVFIPENKIDTYAVDRVSYDLIERRQHALLSKHTWDDDLDKNVIIQPADTDLTVLRRIEEVILRIIYTTDLVFH